MPQIKPVPGTPVNPVLAEKMRAVETALSQIDRQYGKGAIMRLGDHPPVQISAIPTGSIAVDAALGVGGVPRGRVIEIYRREEYCGIEMNVHGCLSQPLHK